MEKIKITPEQESALKEFIHMTVNEFNEKPFARFIREGGSWAHQYKPINEFTHEQFALLLIDHYDVEEDWKSWEYAKSTVSSVVYTKEKIKAFHTRFFLEKATKEEYTEYLFNSYGRSYGEFKVGDTLAHCSDFYFIVENSDSIADAEAYFKDGHIKYIYFVENRKEILN
jgi:hypothetical protein